MPLRMHSRLKIREGSGIIVGLCLLYGSRVRYDVHNNAELIDL